MAAVEKEKKIEKIWRRTQDILWSVAKSNRIKKNKVKNCGRSRWHNCPKTSDQVERLILFQFFLIITTRHESSSVVFDINCCIK